MNILALFLHGPKNFAINELNIERLMNSFDIRSSSPLGKTIESDVGVRTRFKSICKVLLVKLGKN